MSSAVLLLLPSSVLPTLNVSHAVYNPLLPGVDTEVRLLLTLHSIIHQIFNSLTNDFLVLLDVLARDPAPSAGPTVSRRGKVAVTDTDGNPLGYIGGTSYKKGIYQIVKSTGDVAGATDALTITFELGLTATAGEQLEFSVSVRC